MRFASSQYALNASAEPKRADEHYLRALIDRYKADLKAYVVDTYPRESEQKHYDDLYYGDPYIAWTCIVNHRLSEDEKWRKIIRYYEMVEGCLTVIIGGKGEMKTTVAWDLAWEIHLATGRAVEAVMDPDGVPDWATPIIKLEDATEGAIIVTDELAILFGARTSNTTDQRNLNGILALVRQNNNILIGIVQNLSTTDKNIIVQADQIIIKPIGLTQKFTERKGIDKILEYWREILPRSKPELLFLARRMHPIKVWRDRPDWMDAALNRAFKKFQTEREAIAAGTRRRAHGMDWKVIKRQLASRWTWDDKTWKTKILAANGGVDPKADPDRAPKPPVDAAEA